MQRSFVLLGVCFWTLFGTGEASMAQTVDPSRERDIVKLMEVTDSAKITEQAVTLVTSQLMDLIRQIRPEVPQRAVEILKEVVQTKCAASVRRPDGLLPRIIRLYAKHFTHDEIRALLAFYGTDVGRKIIAVMPTLSQEAAHIGEEWGSSLVPEIQPEVEKRLRAEGLIK